MSEPSRTMKWQSVEDIMLVVHANTEPDAREWKGFIDACREQGRRSGLRCLLVLANVALSPAQRSDAAGVLKTCNSELAAVVTDSRLTRGIVTAIGWFTGVNRAYSPEELDVALRDFRAPPPVVDEVRRTAQRFARELSVEQDFFRASSSDPSRHNRTG